MDAGILVKMEVAISVMQSYIAKDYVLSCAMSGGKDSSCVMVLMLEAIRRSARHHRGSHYILSADTTIENPAVANHLHAVLEEVQFYAESAGLPVEVHVTKPSLASQFVVSTIGRGTLVRTPENGVKDGKRIRACSDDWKVRPQGRLRTLLAREASNKGAREILTILGMRRSESASRDTAMALRGESADSVIRHDSGALTLSPLADWSTDEIWSMLGALMEPDCLPFPSPLAPATIARLSDVYRAGNGGTCGVVLGESGARAACGSRFGCALCCVSGDRDKSMEFMVQETEHKHLQPLNDFRNYLLAIQWDLSRRDLVGRTISEAGYTRIQADTYGWHERISMLRMLCTIDAMERDRAEEHEANLASGRIEDTEGNRSLCDVQFEFVTPQQLVAIDFFLSMHHYAPHAFPALAVWHDVNVLGRRYPVPNVDPFPKVDVKLHGWYRVGHYDLEAPADGLRDYSAEQWNRYLHPGRASRYARTTGGEQTAYFEEASQFEVDAQAACLFVTCTYDTRFMLETQARDAIESARFWLNEGIVRLPRGMAQRYQDMAKRGQYFSRLALRHNLTPDELDAYLIRSSVGDGEHDDLIVRNSAQADLFAETA
ncbi:phosphoadenosine phosphosulfate reductase family protein [Caballeronia sp. dw_19]|uniref:phosphoadenosine phosphosulfate reductase domain-containing protein n=1 Tax=Caballeronia sp. dw_19 TaxID=2719791 RepID=UPI001BD6D233|nr:phosphoadenosine phosphosulfate reductase family protein [Caballeronia sp. dw_19]